MYTYLLINVNKIRVFYAGINIHKRRDISLFLFDAINNKKPPVKDFLVNKNFI
jgi:hypothetical protein